MRISAQEQGAARRGLREVSARAMWEQGAGWQEKEDAGREATGRAARGLWWGGRTRKASAASGMLTANAFL